MRSEGRKREEKGEMRWVMGICGMEGEGDKKERERQKKKENEKEMKWIG